MFREKNNNDEASNESTDGIWTVVDHVQPHVRALTIRRLLTDSGEQKRYLLSNLTFGTSLFIGKKIFTHIFNLKIMKLYGLGLSGLLLDFNCE